jgi:hypothetical protein
MSFMKTPKLLPHILLGICALTALVVSAADKGGDVKDPVPGLITIAGDPGKCVAARATSIDMLGTYSSSSQGKANTAAPKQIAEGLRTILATLNTTPRTDTDANNLMTHIVQALGQVGPPSAGALDIMADSKGRDPTLDQGIDAAYALILAPPKDQPKPPAVPPEKQIITAYTQLTKPNDKTTTAALVSLLDAGNPAEVRLFAVKALATYHVGITDSDKAKLQLMGAGDPDLDVKAGAKALYDKLK